MRVPNRLGTTMVTISLLAGCGGAPAAAPESEAAPAAEAAPASTEERIAASYAGPKIRVAVGKFEELEGTKPLFDALGWKGLGPMVTEQAVTALVKTGRVTVLERTQIGKVIGLTRLETQSSLDEYFDQETTVEAGRLLGSQAVLVGAITEFEPDVAGAGAGIDIALLGGLRYHEDKAVIGMELRLVHQETGRVLRAATGRAEVHHREVGGGATYEGVSVGGGAWSRTPIGVATRRALDAALAELVAGLPAIPWEGKVVDVRGPDKVFIGAGRDLNLKPGDRFRIVHRGEPITGPDGAVIGYDETDGGWIELVKVQPKMSIAKVLEGDPPKKGDLVRLPVDG